MTTVHMRPRDSLRPDPDQPRKQFDEDEIDRLGDDMLARGILIPLLVRLEGNQLIIVDGGRRWLAAGRKGIKELPVIITDKIHTPAELRGIQIATAIHKSDLTASDMWVAGNELMELNPAWQLTDLAKFLHLSPSAITKQMSPSKCSAAWQKALADGLVGIGDCYVASGLPEAEQAALLSLKLSGASRDEIVNAVRKSRNQPAKAVKLTRVKCLLPSSGVSIIASGAELSLDALVQAFSEAQKEAKKALNQGQDIKSFQAVMTAKNKNRSE